MNKPGTGKKSIPEHLKEMAKEHGGDHYHLVGHEDGYTAHMVTEDGEASETEHKTIKQAKRHMEDCMGDGE